MLRVLAFLLLSLAVHLAVGQLLREPRAAQAITAPQVLEASRLQLVAAPRPPAAAVAPPTPVRQAAKQAVAVKPVPAKRVPVATPPAPQSASSAKPQATPPAAAPVDARPSRPAQPVAAAELAEIVSLQPSFRQPPQQPRYPTQARRRNQQGTVLLEVRLDERGAQRGLSVLRSSGVASLDRAALEAVAQWRFNPETANGRAVPSRVQIPIQFALTASR